MSVCVTEINRVSKETLSLFKVADVATVHDAQGRKGLLTANIKPINRGSKAIGSAVTCEVSPNDNWMLHVAVEQCQPGDILGVGLTSPCEDGFFGDLLATSLMARGVTSLIIDASVRDIATLTQMGFQVWSKNVFAQGCVKETVGNVNIPIVCAGQEVYPGDLIVADDDGVVVVRNADIAQTYDAMTVRINKEEEKRARLAAGELGLDIYKMREKLAQKGLRYIKSLDEN